MQPVNTSTTTGGSNDTLGIIGSSHGTPERENNSLDLYPEGDSLNVLQPNLEEDVSAESLLANKKLRAAWWRVNGPKYPILARMARDVLSVPLTTVASESAFSSAKRILDDYRCKLLPETIESIMCSHDWLQGRIPAEPRFAEDDMVISESSIPTRSEEDQTDDA